MTLQRSVLVFVALMLVPAGVTAEAGATAPTIEASFADDTLSNGGAQSTTTLDVSTSADSVVVSMTRSGESVSSETLTDILSDDGLVGVRDGEAEYLVSGDERSIAVDVTEKRGGIYNVTVRTPDGSAEATASAMVMSTCCSVEFAENTVTTARGGLVDVTIDTRGYADSGTLIVGGRGSGYRAEVAFADGGDDRVTIRFDTFAAGNDSLNVVSARNATDEVRLVNQTERESMLELGEYVLTIWSGEASDPPPDRASFSVLTVTERNGTSTENVTVSPSPSPTGTPIATAPPTPTASPMGTTAGPAPTETSAPGFGVLATLLSLAVAVGAKKRQ